MDRQPDLFGQMHRQWQARMKLLDSLRIDPRALALLRVLDDITQEQNTPIIDGVMTVAVSLKELQRRLNLGSRNTVKVYVDLAASTPYLDGDSSNHSAHTYRLCWMRIIEDSKSAPAGPGVVECSADRRRDAAQEGTFRNAPKEAIPLRGGQSGGQLTPSKGVNSGVNLEASNGGQLTPSSPLGFKAQGFQGFDLKTQGSKAQRTGGLQSPRPTLLPPRTARGPRTYPREFWPDFKRLLKAGSLADPRHVQRVYEFVVSAGVVPDSETNRLEVFAQAAHDVRLSEIPGLLFKENVAICRWYAAIEDVDWARKAIAQLDRQSEPTPAAAAPVRRQPTESDRARMEARVRRLRHELSATLQGTSPQQLVATGELPEGLRQRLAGYPTWSHLDRNWWLLWELLEAIAERTGVALAVE